MCHSLQPLAVHSPRRKVMRCSCGALHVVWDNLNLSLSPEEFDVLTELVTPERDGDQGLGGWHLVVQPLSVGLWYGPFGATFSRADFQTFRTLLGAVQMPVWSPQPAAYALN